MKNNIREIRQKRGLTLTELAKRLNMGKGNLSNIETGKLGLTQENINKLSEILKVSSSEILGDQPINQESLIKIKYIDNILLIKNCQQFESADEFVLDEKFLFFLGIKEKFKKTLIIKAPNNSMYPVIETGDIIFVDTTETIIIRDGLYLIQEQGIMQIRQVVIEKESTRIRTYAINKGSFGNLENSYKDDELDGKVCGKIIFYTRNVF